MHPENGTTSSGSTSGGTMLRMLGAQQKREVKATQNLSIIVLFFMICWIPLYTINCIIAFCSNCKISNIYMNPFIILSHVNSAGNPLLYAYHLKDFRAALKQLIYTIFRIDRPVPFNYNGRQSIGSTNAFTASNYGRSIKENRFGMSLRKDSSLHIRKSDCYHIEEPRMAMRTSTEISSIVPKSFALAAATVSTDRNNEDLWRISEIPSISPDSDYENRISPYKGSGSDQSANVNSAFLDCSNFDVVSDDVFLDDMCAITYRNSDLDTISDNKINETAVISTIKNNLTDCMSSSSPQLTRNLFLIETDLLQKSKKRKFVRSFSEVTKETKVVAPKRGKKLSLSGEFIPSPNKSIKFSSIKVTDNYLLKKRTEESSDENLSFRNSKDDFHKTTYNFDNHSFSS